MEKAHTRPYLEIHNTGSNPVLTTKQIKTMKKQETLEEAARSNYKRLYEGEPLTQEVPIDAFKQGAKWQQENSNINALDFEIDSLKREIKVLKHQQERSYSEEELLQILESHKDNLEFDKDRFEHDRWFEQFKKK